MGTNAQPYRELRTHLDTGDVLLFDGASRLSLTLKWFQRSEFSHVGMVVRPPGSDLVMCIESTTLSNVRDIVNGTGIEGVQLVLLSERLAKYDGTISVRRLLGPRNPQLWPAFDAARHELHGRPYEQRKWNLIRAWVDLPGFPDADTDLSSLFCSELVAELYMRMQLLPPRPSSAEYIPADFGERNVVCDRVATHTAGMVLGATVQLLR